MDKRLQYLDVARGIAILLVVFGHTLIKDFANSNLLLNYLRFYVYTIHMPIFFVISGILFEKNIKKYCKFSKSEYVKNKFLKFMIPYFSFSVFNYLLVFLLSNFSLFAAVLKKEGFIIFGFFNSLFSIITYINHIDNHLWFLYVMFIILIINRVFFNDLDCRRNRFFIIILIILLYYLYICFSSYIPEIVFKVMRYNLIFIVGRIVYRFGSIFKNARTNRCVFIICFIFSMFLFLIKDEREIWFYSLINLIVELTFSIWIIFSFSNLCINNKVLNYFGNGEKSMVIYLLHMPFVLPFIVFILTKMNLNVFAIIPISFISSLFVCFVLYNFILSKSKIIKKYFFGFVN